MTSTTIDKEQIKEATDNVIDAAEQKALEGLEAARKAAKDATDKVQALEVELSKSVNYATTSASDYMKEKPLQAAGIAFAAGVVTALLFRGR